MRTAASRLLLLLVFVAASACESSQLVAPIASSISLLADVTTLPPGGSTEVVAVVIEEAGTPVHDGTVVQFFSTLGTVDPREATTRDGLARATFTAGQTAGTAVITALSGGAVGGDPDNELEIVISASGGN